MLIHTPIMPKWTMTGKAIAVTMETMFAPYCATCGTRRMLPISRIVGGDWERGGTLFVRCNCGSVIDADARPPTGPAELPRAS
jgi:hypothetical protein